MLVQISYTQNSESFVSLLEFKSDTKKSHKMTFTEDEAQKLAEELKDNPNDFEKWYRLGVGYLYLNSFGNAEVVFKQCLKLDQEHTGALGNLGIAYLRRGKAKASIKNLEKSLKRNPGVEEFWTNLGVAYLQINKANDAVDALKHSIAIRPDNRDTLVALAHAYNYLEQWEDALDTLSQADVLFPDDYEIFKGKARALMKLGRRQELEETYMSMRRLDPEDHTIVMYLGQIAFERGERSKGLNLYRQAVEMEPESYIAWKVLIDALKRMGMKEEAEKAHQKFKEIEEKLRKSGTRIIPKM